jgi:phospholipid N-methyltransferase
MKIKDETLKILAECTIKNSTVFLPKIQLDRKTYLDVNKHLENLGGKWNRKAKGHVFDSDPTDSFENMLLTGETADFKKEFQFFETPPELADKMVKMLDVKEDSNILEPSAGRGALIDSLLSGPDCDYISAVELNPENCNILVKKGFGIVEEGDFLSLNLDNCWEETFDRIIMNPPFTKQQDIDHILHAYSLLNDGGILVSVVSESPFFRENKKSVEFREFLDNVNAEIIKNPEGTFKSSGTMVRTRIVKIVKD